VTRAAAPLASGVSSDACVPGATVFFRHLPKTAGTSLITTLANVYGEGRCQRFEAVDGTVAGRVQEFVDAGDGGIVLLSGHVSLETVARGICADEFTVLREPIARLLSMRRFFERLPAAERESLGFGERISVRDLLASRHPQVHGQVRNGMARFFCGADAFARTGDPDHPAPAECPAPVIAAAETALGDMAVGTVEDMPATLRAIGRRLGVPFPLETPMENATLRSSERASVDDIRQLVEANAVDVALYHALAERLGRAGAIPERGPDPRTLFDPLPGQRYLPPWIPGRQGFEICRVGQPVSWIGPTGRGRIHLAPASQARALCVVLFAVSPRYPADRVVFLLDGRPWPRSLVRGPGHEVYRLQPIPPHAGVLELAIEQPAAVPVAVIDPGTADERNLGVALLEIGCDAA